MVTEKKRIRKHRFQLAGLISTIPELHLSDVERYCNEPKKKEKGSSQRAGIGVSRICFFVVTCQRRVRKRSNCSGEHAKQAEREVDGGERTWSSLPDRPRTEAKASKDGEDGKLMTD